MKSNNITNNSKQKKCVCGTLLNLFVRFQSRPPIFTRAMQARERNNQVSFINTLILLLWFQHVWFDADSMLSEYACMHLQYTEYTETVSSSSPLCHDYLHTHTSSQTCPCQHDQLFRQPTVVQLL